MHELVGKIVSKNVIFSIDGEVGVGSVVILMTFDPGECLVCQLEGGEGCVNFFSDVPIGGECRICVYVCVSFSICSATDEACIVRY
jgi:hypothetical protein